ncbi:MAG TPA: DnaA N-terminal domain-containing protein [Leptolinea sp.]
MDQLVQNRTFDLPSTTVDDAWEMILGTLHTEMDKTSFETWVKPLRPVSYRDGVFTVGARNTYGRDWVEARLRSRMTHMLEGMLAAPVKLRLTVVNEFFREEDEEPVTRKEKPSNRLAAVNPDEIENQPVKERSEPEASPRKILLARAYGSERARAIQPERGLFLTLYFFEHWLPLFGHSSMAVILAARSMCFWNPKTGELRNRVETDMTEIAGKANVSIRTVKDVLGGELVRKCFLRYTVRRMMTPNGVRTAGITLMVRMDDPLTPEDQDILNLPEAERWYPAEFEDETEE